MNPGLERTLGMTQRFLFLYCFLLSQSTQFFLARDFLHSILQTYVVLMGQGGREFGVTQSRACQASCVQFVLNGSWHLGDFCDGHDLLTVSQGCHFMKGSLLTRVYAPLLKI